MNTVVDRNQLVSAINSGKPFKSYIKTILGKVYVTVWDVFQNIPVGVILEGDPKTKADGSYIDLYTEYEDSFFRKHNKRHFDLGNLVEYVRKEEEKKEKQLEAYSDEELKALINSPFLKLQNALNKTQSVALLFRMEGLAIDLEKSEKVVGAIRSRLSEVQQEEMPRLPNQLEEEL